MDGRLRAEHGLSLRAYEVLLLLGESSGGRARRVDIAERVLLTQGGVTRLLDGLEREGLVGKSTAEHDRRVVFAVLTAEGRRRLRAAQRTHRADIDAAFTSRFDGDELETLDRLLARLPGGGEPGAWRAPARDG